MDEKGRIRQAFESIEAGEKLKASTENFLREARRKEERKQRRSMFPHLLRHVPQLACAALVLALGISGYVMLLVPVSYVSIDVNPSIELELNRMDRVISAKAYNEDGEKVLEGLSLEWKHYMDAVDLVVESDRMQPYLAGDAALTFTVASGSQQREELLLTGIRNCHGCAGHGGTSVGTDVDMVEDAHESGLSLGKYAAYNILRQYDDTITAADCRNMTMAEIRSLIREHESCGEHHETEGNEGDGNGSTGGHGGGHGAGSGGGSGSTGGYGGGRGTGTSEGSGSTGGHGAGNGESSGSTGGYGGGHGGSRGHGAGSSQEDHVGYGAGGGQEGGRGHGANSHGAGMN